MDRKAMFCRSEILMYKKFKNTKHSKAKATRNRHIREENSNLCFRFYFVHKVIKVRKKLIYLFMKKKKSP